MGGDLRLCYWNAQTLTGKKKLLELFLREQNIDAMLICETHLNQTAKLKIPNYIVYRKDEVSPFGQAYRGLAVLVHRRLVHQEIPRVDFQSIQALGVVIELPAQKQKLRLFAIYKPPLEKLQAAEIRALLHAEDATILAGDMNSKHTAWNSGHIDTNDRILYNDSLNNQYEVMGPDTWTHYDPGGNGSIIDLVIAKGLKTQLELAVMNDLPSDHRPVIATLKDTPSRVARRPPGRKICWETFQKTAAEKTKTRPIMTADEVNLATDELTTAIQTSLSTATHTTESKGRILSLPTRIRKLIREKRETRKLWQETRCPRTKRRLNALIEQVKVALDEHAADDWEDHILNISEEIPSVHRLCRQLTDTPRPTQPLLDRGGALKFEAKDRAEILAESLEAQFQPNPTTDTDHVRRVEQHLREYFSAQPSTEEEETSNEENREPPIVINPVHVRRLIQRLPRRKAPGMDGITNEALKHLPPKTVVALTRIYNGILRSGHFPDRWKLGKVVMLPKPGKDARKPESYRPITLLSTMSKVFERCLLFHLKPHVTPREEQFGFRAEHSTTLQITKMVNEMATCHNKKEYVVAVFLDMEKAFDRVWHEGLLYKLSKSAAPRKLIEIIANFLRDRRFVVAVEDVLSAEKTVKAGVPQGSCISPICYAWYTDDIPVVGQVKLALYADDAAYFTSSYKPAFTAKKLQPTLDALPEWLMKWRLSVNVAKTQAFITGSCNLPDPLKLQGKEIQWLPNVKYLGITINRKLTFGKQVDHIIGSVRGARAKLLPILYSRLPIKTKLLIYKTYLRSRLTYATPAWYPYISATNRKRLQAQENVALRKIVNAPRYVRNATIHRDLKHEDISSFVRRLTTKMFERADASNQDHLRGIAPLHARPPDEPGKRKTKGFSRDLIAPQQK